MSAFKRFAGPGDVGVFVFAVFGQPGLRESHCHPVSAVQSSRAASAQGHGRKYCLYSNHGRKYSVCIATMVVSTLSA